MEESSKAFSPRIPRLEKAKNVLCLAIDRIDLGFLGAYGNTWIETSAFDSLAAESVLFDSYFATSLDLTTLYRALWRGERPSEIRASDDPTETDAPSLFKIFKERGYRTFVVSDSEEVALSDAIEEDVCDGRFFLGSPEATQPAESPEDTKFYRNFEDLARFVARLEDEAESGDERPIFIWARFSGWNDVWDFPLANREIYRETEDDPDPYQGVEPPYFPAKPNLSADEKLERQELRQSVVEAYCGGISVFDETLEGFVQFLKETGFLSKTLFVLLGERGLGLGAPSPLGLPPTDAPEPFYAEEVRQPLLFRLPDATGATVRLPALCEPRDVFATIRDWSEFANELSTPDFWRLEPGRISAFARPWTLDAPSEPAPESSDSPTGASSQDPPGQNLLRLLADETGSVRDRVLVVAKDADSTELALATPTRFFKETPVPSDDPLDEAPKFKRELFVLPDDRFCANDVASRCLDEVEVFSSLCRAVE
ncbi:MAG: sulfatase-like hydrolase/transferase [Thermoguttaceae bacterium]|nr:sulfatase-like hydrolase/transferase [Thermoguttaceae bacterium]